MKVSVSAFQYLVIYWCLYMQAVKYIESDSSFSEEEKKQAKALKVACNLNNAACKLKLKDYKQAEKLCTKVGIIFITAIIIYS